MNKYVFFEQEHIVLINFISLFKNIEINCLNDLFKYDLHLNFKLNNVDTKRIIYHNIIYSICEEFINNNSDYIKVLIIPRIIPSHFELFNYCSSIKFDLLLNTLIKYLQKYLPFIILYDNDLPCNNIFTSKHQDNGMLIDTTNIILSRVNNIQNRKFSFENMKLFTKKYGLVFISSNYFEEIQIKQHLLQ